MSAAEIKALLSEPDECGVKMGPQWVDLTTEALMEMKPAMSADVSEAVERLTEDLQEGRIKDLAVSRDVQTVLAALQEGSGALPASLSVSIEGEASFQSRVLPWLMECFGAEIAADRVERCDRFIEEALELAQSLDWTADRAHALVDYVYGRPKGEPHQEVGGVMVTLAALCQAADLDMKRGGDDELARIMRPEIVLKIRAKQAAKPTGSALPVAASQAGMEARQSRNETQPSRFDVLERIRAFDFEAHYGEPEYERLADDLEALAQPNQPRDREEG